MSEKTHGGLPAFNGQKNTLQDVVSCRECEEISPVLGFLSCEHRDFVFSLLFSSPSIFGFSLSPKSSKRARARFQNHTRSQGMICKLAVMIIVNRDFGTNFSQFPPQNRSYWDSTSGAQHGMEGKNRLSERELSLIDFGMDVKCFRGIVRSCNSSARVVRHCGDTCVFTY